MTAYLKAGLLTLALTLTLSLVEPTSTHAQTAVFNPALQTLIRENSYRPEKSPKHERSSEILDDRILDSSNRVVGTVNDVILSRNGSIQHLDVDFDRLKLGTDSLIVSYADLNIRPVSNGYKMAYTDDQIEEIFPALLSNIATASGGDRASYTLKSIVGSNVVAQDGRKLGKVEEVLFDSLGGRAELIFVSMSYKTLRGEGVAIPFNTAKYETKSGSSVTATVPNNMADAMIEYAKEN